MPRYLGIVFPALAIGLAAIYLRLPRPARRLAIGLFLAVNLVQSVARLVVPTEAPVSKVARDVWQTRDPGGIARTYVQIPAAFGFSPGGGNVQSVVGLYHLRLLSHSPLRPVDFRFTPSDTITPIHRFYSAGQLADELADLPRIHRVILWSLGEPKDLAGRLGDGWRQVATEAYPVRVYWTWAYSYTYCRSVWER